MSTAIEWTEETWNPLTGCSAVSPGCDNCYAAGLAGTRLRHLPQYEGLTVDGEWTGEIRLDHNKLNQPHCWKKSRRIFVNSMSDLFHPNVPLGTIADIFDVMAQCPQHTFQVLTKRPKRMRMILSSLNFANYVTSDQYDKPFALPLPNVHLGVSIESNKYAYRADHLRNTPAAVRWISAEPLLGPLPSLDLTGIDWLVVGGETGKDAREMDLEWAQDLAGACDWHGADCPQIPDGWESTPIPFFMKQLGSAHGKDHKNIDSFPVDLRVREYPEVAS